MTRSACLRFGSPNSRASFPGGSPSCARASGTRSTSRVPAIGITTGSRYGTFSFHSTRRRSCATATRTHPPRARRRASTRLTMGMLKVEKSLGPRNWFTSQRPDPAVRATTVGSVYQPSTMTASGCRNHPSRRCLRLDHQHERQQLVPELAVAACEPTTEPSSPSSEAANREGWLRVLTVSQPALAGQELDPVSEIGEPGGQLRAPHGEVAVAPVRELLDHEDAARTVGHRATVLSVSAG